ncbi:MAG: hypothetical protein AB2A00_16430 [Myxococcota bacterium]
MPHARLPRLPVPRAARWLLLAALTLCGCGPVQLECTVCGEPQSFTTCQDLYCRYLAAGSLCATRDLQECFSRYGCPSPYFLFCPSDTRNE